MDDIEVSPGVLVKPKGVFKILQLVSVRMHVYMSADLWS